MTNSFKNLQDVREAMLPPDIEHRLLHQMGTFSLFGRVVELFVPNALNTVARLIDGDCNGHGDCDDDEPDWRYPAVDVGPSPDSNDLLNRWRK